MLTPVYFKLGKKKKLALRMQLLIFQACLAQLQKTVLQQTLIPIIPHRISWLLLILLVHHPTQSLS